MHELVEDDADYESCQMALAERRILTQKQRSVLADPLKNTYDQVLNLHRRSWNGIRFRIVRNFFRSATAGEVDVIVRDPPWIRRSKLPDANRVRAIPTREQYEIFSETPHHGGNELNISGMITYTTADKWLRPGGTLAFVITQTHFHSPSSQGFRRFRINSTHRLTPLSVDDMKALKPFPEAANKTSVVVFRKRTKLPKYPVPYRIWTPSKGNKMSYLTDSPIAAVMDRVSVHEYEANHVGSEGSPWAVLPPGRFTSVSSIRGRSDWVQGRKGITADLNAIYFVPIDTSNKTTGLVRVFTRPESGRTNIGFTRSFWVESRLLYPLM